MPEYESNGLKRITELQTATEITDDMVIMVDSPTGGAKQIPANTPNSELKNIRVGADGVTYASAGDAVRNQFINKQDELNFIESLINNVIYFPEYVGTGYYNGDGYYFSSSDWKYTPIFAIKPNTSYSLNVSNNQYVTLYDNSKNVIQGTPGSKTITTPSNAYYMRLSIYKDNWSECKLTEKVIYDNHINDIDNNLDVLFKEEKRTYITRSESFPMNNGRVDSGYSYDFSQPIYIKIKNNDINTGRFVAAIYQDDTLKQPFEKTIASGQSDIIELFCANTDGIHEWMGSNKYFTDYTWNIYLQNRDLKNAEFDIFTIDDETPINGNKIICSTDGNGAFKDISDAVAYAKSKFNVMNENVTIFIKNGVYTLSPVDSRNAVIDKGANRISLIGEDRDHTIIILNSTPAHNNKVVEHGGASTIANLTIKNLWNEDGSTHSYTHNSYCIHNDLPFSSDTEYITTLENCVLYSEVFAPIGAGLQNNQKQIYKNVVSIFNSLDETPRGYNQWAPFYIHAPGDSSARGCSLEIDNCTGIAKKGTVALTLPNVSGSIPYSQIPVTLRRNIFTTNGSVVTNVNKNTHDIQTDSALNNVESLNY